VLGTKWKLQGRGRCEVGRRKAVRRGCWASFSQTGPSNSAENESGTEDSEYQARADPITLRTSCRKRKNNREKKRQNAEGISTSEKLSQQKATGVDKNGLRSSGLIKTLHRARGEETRDRSTPLDSSSRGRADLPPAVGDQCIRIRTEDGGKATGYRETWQIMRGEGRKERERIPIWRGWVAG